jgi:hypothetical protein
MKFSTSATLSSVTSMRVPLGARTAISKAPESTSGKKSRRSTGTSSTSVTGSNAKPVATVATRWRRTKSSPPMYSSIPATSP